MAQPTAQGGTGRSIIISALSAQFEKAADQKLGKLDPYFELELSGTKVQTKTVKGGGLNPAWEVSDGWRLHDQGGHPYLIARAFNKHTLGKDTSLGEGQIALEELFTSSDTKKEVPLADSKGKTGVFMFNVREHMDDGNGQGVRGAEAAGAAGVAGTGTAAASKHAHDKEASKSALAGKSVTTDDHLAHDGNLNVKDTHARGGIVGADRTDQVVDRQGGGIAGDRVYGVDKGAVAGGAAAGGAAGYAAGRGAGDTANLREGGIDAAPGNPETANLREGNMASGAAAGAGVGAAAGLAAGELSDREKVAAKHELIPQEMVAEAGEHIAPAQQHGREIETVAGQSGTRGIGGTAAGAAAGGAAGGLAGAAGTRTEDSEERHHEESYDRKETSSKTVNQFDTRGMETSEEHWQKAQEATEEARKQARIVEQMAIQTTTVAHEVTEVQRTADSAHRQHLEAQERLSTLDLESKRAAAARAKELYEAESTRLNPLSAAAQQAQQRVAGLDDAVHAKGATLQSAVEETEARKQRLAQLAAAMAAAQAAAAEAEARHRDHLAALAPLRAKHDRSLTEAQRLEAELAEIQRRRAELEALEARHTQALAAARTTQQDQAAKIAQLEPVIAQDAQQLQGTRGQLAELAGVHGTEAAAVAAKRAEVERMNRDTLALMEQAKREKADADAAHMALLKAQEAAQAKQRDLMARQQSLGAAENQAGTLRSQVDQYESEYHEATRHVEDLQQELLVSKQRVDLAQARKEELWEQAKVHGEAADKAADAHFLQAAEAHKQLLGSTPGGHNPEHLTNKSDLTEKLVSTEPTQREV